MKDEALILYYYEDGLSAAERREIATKLHQDTELAERYKALASELDAMREPADVQMPPGLEHRLQTTLQRAARLEDAENPRRAGGFHHWSFFAGAAVAGALALGIGIGVWMAGDNRIEPPLPWEGPATAQAEWSSAAFVRGLESHFRSSRQELASLGGAAESNRAELARALLEQNQLFARLALQNDAPELARVLRSFEPNLARLGREDLSPQEAAALQAQLEFEFKVMLTKLARASSQTTEPVNKELSL